MKRVLSLVLVLLLAFTLTACDVGTPNGDAPTTPTENTPETIPETGEPTVSELPTVEEQVVVDQNGIKVTLTALDFSSGMPELEVLVENNGDKAVTVQVRNCSVNGFMQSWGIIFSADVETGKKSNETISFSNAELAECGITNIGVIELSFHVFDPDTWDAIFDTEQVVIETSAAGTFTPSTPETKSVLFEQDGIKISFVGFDETDPFDFEAVFYIENDTDAAITVQARDSSINGFMIDGTMSCDVMPGKKAITDISFFQTDLEDNGIENIENIELKFHISDPASWDTIVDTEPITLQ